MRNIMQAIEEHKAKVLEQYPIYQVLGIFVYGSQNYSLATKDSDVDTKAIIVPTIENLALNPIKTRTLVLDNGEHCEIMDIMHLVNNYKKQNINFVETLFTPYYWINTHYINIWNKYFAANAEQIARYNPQYALKSICGQAIHTLKQDKLNGKKVGNGIRLQYFLSQYFQDKNYLECIIPDGKTRNEILLIKNKMLQFEDRANELINWFEEKQNLIVSADEHIKEEVDYILNKGIIALIRYCDAFNTVEFL